MKFVVTGGAGFIGSHIVKLLVNKGHSVDVIDNLHTGKKENLGAILNEINFYQIDIRGKEELQRIMKDCDGVFHQAALTVVPESFKIPQEYFDVNVKGTRNIFEIAKNEKLRVVHASSSSVYGNVDKIPITENFEKNPVNPYGKTKLEDELLAEKFSKEGTEIIGLRYFNVFGIGQTGSYAGVITKFMNALSEKKSPIIYGDGSQVRDFVYVEDVAKANFASMMNKTEFGFFNVGTGKAVSIKELAELMIKLYKLELTPKYSKALLGDIKQSKADPKQMKDLIGWEYETKLEDGLKNMLNI
jgi:UDP-glucose 4-epimerase